MFLKRKQIDERLDELIWQTEAEAVLPDDPTITSKYGLGRRHGTLEGKVAGLRMAKELLGQVPAAEGRSS